MERVAVRNSQQDRRSNQKGIFGARSSGGGDNGSATLGDMLKKWNVLQFFFFRDAYRPSGNGIAERNHKGTVLHVSLYRYAWRYLKVELRKQEETTGTIEL